MRRIAQYLLALVLAGGMLMANAQNQPQPQTQARKKRIAIIDFEYGTVRSGVAGLFGTDVDVGKGICDLLVKHLVRDGSYTLIERRALDKILAEQNFSTSDRANPATAAKIGSAVVGAGTALGPEGSILARAIFRKPSSARRSNSRSSS